MIPVTSAKAADESRDTDVITNRNCLSNGFPTRSSLIRTEECTWDVSKEQSIRMSSKKIKNSVCVARWASFEMDRV